MNTITNVVSKEIIRRSISPIETLCIAFREGLEKLDARGLDLTTLHGEIRHDVLNGRAIEFTLRVEA